MILMQEDLSEIQRESICWFIFGGFISGMAWVFSGALWCITIVGIPYGLQCFKFATISFWPFGRRIEYGGGAVSFLVNVIWFLVNGWWMALGNFLIGVRKRIIIVNIGFMNLVMYNPVLLKKDTPYETEEGCLSLEGVRKTTRYQNIEVEYLDSSWKKHRQ